MTCEEFAILLEDYVDGTLGAAEAARVEVHLHGCEACTGELELIRRENAFYITIAGRTDVPVPDWSDVRAAIASDRPAGHRPSLLGRIASLFAGVLAPAPALAAVAAAVLATGGVSYVVLRGEWQRTASVEQPATQSDEGVSASNEPDPVPKPVSPPEATSNEVEEAAPRRKGRKAPRPRRRAVPKPRPVPRDFPLEMVRNGNPELVPAAVAVAHATSIYESAIRELTPVYERRKAAFGTGAGRRLDSTIAEIDRAISGTRRAVMRNPGDPEALQSLMAVYAQKVDVLQEVASR